jgi:hypothetical protein
MVRSLFSTLGRYLADNVDRASRNNWNRGLEVVGLITQRNTWSDKKRDPPLERVECLSGYGAREVVQVFVMMLRQCEVELAAGNCGARGQDVAYIQHGIQKDSWAVTVRYGCNLSSCGS